MVVDDSCGAEVSRLRLGERHLRLGQLLLRLHEPVVCLDDGLGARLRRLAGLDEVVAGGVHVADRRRGVVDHVAVAVDRGDVVAGVVAERSGGLVERVLGLGHRLLGGRHAGLGGGDGIRLVVVVVVAARRRQQRHRDCHRHQPCDHAVRDPPPPSRCCVPSPTSGRPDRRVGSRRRRGVTLGG